MVTQGRGLLPGRIGEPISCRTAGFPQYGWKPPASLRVLPQLFPVAFDAEPAFRSIPGSVSRSSVRGWAHRPLAQRGLTWPACKRYYGLRRRSDELRQAWAFSAYAGRSWPWRAVGLTFPSLPGHTIAETGLAPASVSKVDGCTSDIAFSKFRGSRSFFIKVQFGPL